MKYPVSFDRSGQLVRSLAVLCCIITLTWLVYSWTGYARRNAHIGDGFHLSSSQLLELTLVREDRDDLACASDAPINGLRCGYQQGGKPVTGEDPKRVLQPYMTTKNELLLGAGLWQSPALAKPLPPGRFTTICNYRLAGATRSVSLRWRATGSFEPYAKVAPVVSLSDCVIPE